MDVVVPLIVFLTVGAATVLMASADHRPEQQVFLRRTLALALAVRVLVALLFDLVPGTRVFHEDASGYEWLGNLVSQAWSGHGPPVTLLEGRPNTGYIYFVAALHYVIGQYRIIASLANAVIGVMTVAVVYRIAIELFHPVVARRAARLVAFFPSMILWSSIAIKDPLVSLLTAVSLLGAIRLKRQITAGAVLMTALPIVALQPLRFYIVYFVLFAIGISLLLERGLRSLSGVYKQIAVGTVIVVLMAGAGLTSRVSSDVSELSLERVSSFRRGMATTAQSGFAHDVDVSTPKRAMLFVPVGAASLLLAPFPWQFTSLRALLTAPEMLLWWSMLPALWRGLSFVRRERWREASPLLLFAGSLTVGYGLMEGNIGAAFRQRAQIFIFLFIFAALGTYVRRVREVGLSQELLLERAVAPAVVSRRVA
jgi:hypothetical protein